MSKAFYIFAGGVIGAATGYAVMVYLTRPKFEVIYDPETEDEIEELTFYYNPALKTTQAALKESEERKAAMITITKPDGRKEVIDERLEDYPVPPEDGTPIFPAGDELRPINKTEWKKNPLGYEKETLSYYSLDGVFTNPQMEVSDEWEEILDPIVPDLGAKPAYYIFDDAAIMFEIIPKLGWFEEDATGEEIPEDNAVVRKARKATKEAQNAEDSDT